MIFFYQQTVSVKMGRWFAHGLNNVPTTTQRKSSAKLYVLIVMSNKGDVTPLYFFHKDSRITKKKKVYL